LRRMDMTLNDQAHQSEGQTAMQSGQQQNGGQGQLGGDGESSGQAGASEGGLPGEQADAQADGHEAEPAGVGASDGELNLFI